MSRDPAHEPEERCLAPLTLPRSHHLLVAVVAGKINMALHMTRLLSALKGELPSSRVFLPASSR
jgi:hypothetical protein